ncbi:hypothetical protein CANARDRAFT_193407 [[Candida] arabinofermentans NRRL YB-2248]|uniref:Peroxin/Ferlin domain-containing protein n=1 Tax=[Candida] arabinofermentans NRRL YB-2248 TaxID=983967 RepID=A0A1E4T7N0_9ASCO|nr:hypothetical protein CANARDRAFT_193407 [[Candida] arabinofermentans NRRL YB-2248]
MKARFTRGSHSFTNQKGPPLLPKTHPSITSSLYGVFPFLVLLDRLMSVLTWTNKDPFFNFITIAIYMTIVLQWSYISIIGLPILISLGSCAIIWSVSTVVEDLKSEEFPPTLEEILDTLSNVSLRIEYYLKPSKVFIRMKSSDKVKLLFSLFLMTPVHVFLVTRIFQTRTLLLITGVGFLSYHSPWATATRNILWRSVLIRKISMFATGLEFSMVDKNLEISYLQDYKVIEPRGTGAPITSNPNGKILEFHVIENQRRWVGLGWCNIMLPFERAAFTNEKNVECCVDLQSFKFPHIPHLTGENCKWKWLEENWRIDQKFCNYNKQDGWVYYNNNWEDPQYQDSLTRFTRSRLWTRRALVLVDQTDD